jgi:hypothetical protein
MDDVTLHCVTWLWGRKYGLGDIAKLRAGLERNIAAPFRFFVVRPQAEDQHLTAINGCFARLRLFDPAWQELNGIRAGDRIVCIDLDVVVTGPLDAIFDHDDPFAILQGANAVNPCPYNGSLWQLRAGYRPDVWSDFTREAAARVPHWEFPDDQAWMHSKLSGAARWKVGPSSGIYGYQKPAWPGGDGLPADARLVVFPGWRSPEKFKHLAWVKQHWVEGAARVS